VKLLRDPLFHFVALGLGLFAMYAWTADLFSADDGRRIEMDRSTIERLGERWERQWGRRPTEQELRGLVESRIREEILYREALAVGLDRDDQVVRRRMVQKMELLTQDLASLADPTDTELRAFFDERQEDYRRPPRLDFSHVYFNADRHGPKTEERARSVLAEIRAEVPPPAHASERGDRFMLAYDYEMHTPDQVQRTFGGDFAEVLFDLAPGWHGPLHSGYGCHLVHVGEREASRIPEFDEVRDRLVTDFDRERRERAMNGLVEGLRERYEVTIDEAAIDDAVIPAG
jgi:hypothetical protein